MRVFDLWKEKINGRKERKGRGLDDS